MPWPIRASLLFVVSAFVADGARAEETFPILEMRVLGNTVLEPIEVERAVYPHLGESRTLVDVQAARDALVDVYRQKGFGAVFVDIPEQSVDDGIVRLRVTEGRVDRVRVTGATYFANGQIREALPAARQGEVLNLTALQGELADISRQSRDRVVTPVLRSGRTPGTVDLELKVDDHLPAHGSIEASDRYTADTSRERVSLNLSYDNLFQKFHSLSLQYQTSPRERSEAQVIAATYVAPVPSSRNILAMYVVDTNSDVATVGALSVLGAGRIYGLRLITPLPESEGYSHNTTLGLDLKDFAERIRLTDVDDVTPIKYLHWSAAYSGTYRTPKTNTSVGASLNWGVRGLLNDSDEFGFKRFNARPNYFYLRANFEHERPLVWGTRFALRLNGQYTTAPLISNEQFSIGGAESVRGYLESEELGDLGASGAFELRSPRLFPTIQAAASYVYTFIDAGVIGIIDHLPQQDSRTDLSSWGVGLRFNGPGGLEAQLDWARAIVDSPHVDAGDSRIHFYLRYGL